MTGPLQACCNGDAAINSDAAKTGTVNKYLFVLNSNSVTRNRLWVFWDIDDLKYIGWHQAVMLLLEKITRI